MRPRTADVIACLSSVQGDVVVHVFTEREREYFDLESFYGAAEQVGPPSRCLAALAVAAVAGAVAGQTPVGSRLLRFFFVYLCIIKPWLLVGGAALPSRKQQRQQRQRPAGGRRLQRRFRRRGLGKRIVRRMAQSWRTLRNDVLRRLELGVTRKELRQAIAWIIIRITDTQAAQLANTPGRVWGCILVSPPSVRHLKLPANRLPELWLRPRLYAPPDRLARGPGVLETA